jgi:ubiquinone/menaquinone biosynthesis C-methylase UbiE
MNNKGIKIETGAKAYNLVTPSEKSHYRKKIISLCDLKNGESVLDVGCGTGILSVLAKNLVKDGEVIGLDLSQKMLEQAKKKALKYKLDIEFIEGSIDSLPYDAGRFDVVISSLMFHHLPIQVKKDGLKEIYRVLKNGGRFLFYDFARPHYIIGYLFYLLFVWKDFTRIQLLGKLPGYFRDAGFKNISLKKKGIITEAYLMVKP